MEWTKADPKFIGYKAIFHGVTDLAITITGVSDDLMYYWSGNEIFPSFQVEIIKPGQPASEEAMTPEQLAEIKRNWHSWPVTDLIAEIERLQAALREQIEYNRLRNDRDAYLLTVAEWGLDGKWGVDKEFSERPRPGEFGLE